MTTPEFDPESWTRQSKETWDWAAPGYDRVITRFFEPMARTFIAFARLAPGQRVLELACGSGLATLEAWAAVGPSGKVLGTDLAPGMLALARRRAEAAGAAVELREMNAEALDLPDSSFDAVICQLGLMLFARPDKALSEMARVLRPGGSVSLLVQGEAEKMVFTSVLMKAMVRRAPQLKVPGAPTLFSFGPPGALEKAMSAAGLEPVEARRFAGTYAFASPEEYWTTMNEGAGRTRAMLQSLPEAVQKSVKSDVFAALEAYRRGGEVLVPYEFALARAVKA